MDVVLVFVVLIKAAINGGRSKADHAGVPVTPDEQAAAVVGCLKVGASAIHLHVRSTSNNESPSEGESLDAEDVARTLLAVRSASPKAPIGVSTGAWILPDPAARFAAVAAWETLPDFASVNFIEEGAADLARLLLSKGIAVEAGLSEAKAAEVFVKSGLGDRCLRVLLEPQEQTMASAFETVNAIERVLLSGGIALSRLLHGTEATAWPLLKEALTRGYGVRIGLEDTMVMPDGRLARDNAELVTEAVRRGRTKNK